MSVIVAETYIYSWQRSDEGDDIIFAACLQKLKKLKQTKNV